MQSIDWNMETSNDSNPTEVFDIFHSKLSSIVDKHIALQYLSKKELKHFDKPWITSGIRMSIKLKNNYYKKDIKTRSLYFYNKFKTRREAAPFPVRSTLDFQNSNGMQQNTVT
jgi:hypothetical protein